MADRAGSHQYSITSYWKKLVADYTGLSFLEVEALDYRTYLTWRREAFIYRMSQSEKGQEYLDNAYRMEQTEPDRKALRQKLRKEDPNGE